MAFSPLPCTETQFGRTPIGSTRDTLAVTRANAEKAEAEKKAEAEIARLAAEASEKAHNAE